MKLFILLLQNILLVGLLSSCATQAVRRNLVLYKDGGSEYSIVKNVSTEEFYIVAKTTLLAEKVAKEDLNCRQEICIISHSGVILTVEKHKR